MGVKRISHWVGGKLVPGTSGRSGPVYDPATGVQTAEVDFASVDEVDAAVDEAAARVPRVALGVALATRRGHVPLPRAARRATAPSSRAAITAEHGKVLSDAAGEVARGIESRRVRVRHPAPARRARISEQVSTGVDVYSIRQPLGVVAGITPFNFPAMVPLWMFSNAIACGNTFILKPREKDPSPSLLLAELLAEAGLPDGVFNVVHGDRDAVERDPRASRASPR